MLDRESFLLHLWTHVINASLEPDALQRRQLLEADAPFADSGPAIQRLLALGADIRDLQLLMRDAAYEAVFNTLYSLEDPGIELEEEEEFGLYEELLMADPTGREGRLA